MLEKIIESIILETEQQRSIKEEQLKTTNQKILELDEKIKKLTEELESVDNEISSLVLPVIKDKKDYSLFERMFKNSYNKGRKEGYVKLEEYEKRKKTLKERISEVKNELASVNLERDNYIKGLNVLKNEIDKLTVQLDQFNDRNNIVKYIVETNSELCKEKEFMLELIQENPLYIIYDKSNDITLYMNFFEKILETANINDYEKKLIIKIIDELKNPSPSIEGMYNIPIKYLFEVIRNNIIMERNYFNKDIKDLISGIASGCDYYIRLNNNLPIQYGYELQRLWEDDNIRIGVHCFASFSIVESIFKKGLRCSQQQIGLLDLKYTSVVQNYSGLSFLTLLDYNSAIGSNYIVFALPETCFNEENKEPIWGSHSSTVCGEEYILPQYILGVVPSLPLNETLTALDLSKKKFCHNDCIDKETYEYFFENGCDYTSDKQKRER